MFKKIISAVMLVAIILSTLALSSCGQVETKNPTKEDLEYFPQPGESYSDLYSEEYRQIDDGTNPNFELWFNDATTDIKVKNLKTGFVWSSEKEQYDEIFGETTITRGNIFELQYTNLSGTEDHYSSADMSIEPGQFKITDIENGVKVQYSVGDLDYKIGFPMALSPERYDHFAEAMGEGYANNLPEYYELFDFSTEEACKKYPEEELDVYKKQYDKANDGPWYYMTAATSHRSKVKELNEMFEAAGYTDKDFESDNKNVDIPEINIEEFGLTIIYNLTENGLSVTIPEDQIYYNKDFPLESITVLPSMMEFTNKYEGYYLLPDGSGSIMNFNNDKESLRDKSVYVQMYGVDNSRVIDEKTSYYNDAIFPVFGACVKGKVTKKNKGNFAEENYNGVFGIIESGDTFAGIEAQNYSADDVKNNVLKLEFRINERVKMDAFSYSSSGDNDSKYCKYQFQRYLGDIKFNLNFLSGSDATYSGMAQFYSQKLFGDEAANTTAKDYYSTVEAIGVINTIDKFFGIEYNTKETLTTFDQVAKIATDLQKNGFNNMNIKLSGWCNGGYEHGMVDSIDVESGMGSDNGYSGDSEGLKSLTAALKKEGIAVYPDIDFQNVYAAEETPSSDYRASTLNGSDSVVTTYSPVDFTPTKKLSKYVLNLDGFTENFNGFMEEYAQYGINNISYRSIGKEINSNFKDDETFMERQETLENLIKLVQSKDKDYSIMGTSGQAPFIKYLDVINEMPIESAHFDKCDYSVPFTAMVLSGHVDYTYQPINLSNNNQKDLLLLIESGAGAYYKLTGTKYGDIANTSYDSLYSTVYDEIKDEVIESYSYVAEALDGVYGTKIVKHEQLANDVYKTTYENGTSIYVNYSDKEYVGDGVKVAAESYHKEVGGVE